jgi:hypothetical protein
MSHQDRREPLPAEYQYPTHGVDCDCPPCRVKHYSVDFFANGIPVIRQYNIDSDEIVTRVNVESLRITSTAYGWGV